MTHRERIRGFLSDEKPLVIGAIAENEALNAPLGGCDVIELRLDSLGFGPDVVEFAAKSPLPILITARGAREGGQSDWSIEDRATAYRTLMPYASLIDIELRDFGPLENVIDQAKCQEVLVVGSFHDFEATPSLDTLTSKLNPQRVDIHKFALMAHSLDDIKSHFSLMKILSHQKLSVMGMGPLGAAARPLMAKAGSLLNYGYLGKTPTAPNQWPAALLSDALAL
ncbi:MAG: 3-dehydroquinate dehydratase-1 [Paracoccaceae bacterium]|jgi:3-dehydroquinate dehydratase-1